MKNNNDFRFVIPAELEKGQDGMWRIRGLACSEAVDRQGEKILMKGLDLSPVDAKRGWINYEHGRTPEDQIGKLDGYAKTDKGLVISGTLFKSHKRAQAIQEIMSSLGENDRGRIGLSVEGSVILRDEINPKIIKKCQIRNVAVTFNPVNIETHAELVKSFNNSEIEFNATEENALAQEDVVEEPIFTVAQVSALLKSLGIGPGYAAAADCLTGGDALSMESLDSKKKPKKAEFEPEEIPFEVKESEKEKEPLKTKKLPKMDKCLAKATMIEILDQMQKLYPEVPRNVLYDCVKERLETTYPEIQKAGRLSHKYIRREGAAGSYKYFYRDASGKEVEGKKPSPAQEHEKNKADYSVVKDRIIGKLEHLKERFKGSDVPFMYGVPMLDLLTYLKANNDRSKMGKTWANDDTYLTKLNMAGIKMKEDDERAERAKESVARPNPYEGNERKPNAHKEGDKIISDVKEDKLVSLKEYETDSPKKYASLDEIPRIEKEAQAKKEPKSEKIKEVDKNKKYVTVHFQNGSTDSFLIAGDASVDDTIKESLKRYPKAIKIETPEEPGKKDSMIYEIE